MPRRTRVQTAGVASRLPPEVLAALGAISRVARAAVTTGELGQLAERTLGEIRESLGLTAAAFYIADSADGPGLERSVVSADPPGAPAIRDRLAFDLQAWRFVSSTGGPLVFREPAGWLVENPFEPPANHWLVLPLVSGGDLMGAVVASSAGPIALDPVAITLLSSLGDLLSAAVGTARLRLEVQRTELERERMRLAADLHDGLAQDLALAVREASLLASNPDERQRTASLARLSEAVGSAHRVVRASLEDLATLVPVGGLHAAVQQSCARHRARGLGVELEIVGPAGDVPPRVTVVVLRVLHEALTNVAKHAGTDRAAVVLRTSPRRIELEIVDAGPGTPEDSIGLPGDGHFGIAIARERAKSVGGHVSIGQGPEGGTLVHLEVPLVPPGGAPGGPDR